jgi:uncharacterized protein YciI
MKIFLFLCCLVAALPLVGQESAAYDAELAGELGADDYGMKSYVLVILKEGTKTDFTEERRKELFTGHQNNMRKWAEQGKLIVAGPFYPNENGLEGIFILDIDINEANETLSSDPAISANALSYEAYRWYGSAALPVYLDTHYKIEKIKP